MPEERQGKPLPHPKRGWEGPAFGRPEPRRPIRSLVSASGVFPASIQALYEAAGKGAYHNKTVPAINIRGITYPVARAVFRAALKHRVGALILEMARSEIGYTDQTPAESD